MKIKVYADKETKDAIRKAREEANGHCPCVLPAARCDDTLCVCKEFREAPVGTICHCGLYIKVEN